MAAPVADFTFSPAFGTHPLAVQFTDTSTGNPTSWAWEFDRGASPALTSTDQNPLMSLGVGRWRVKLTASNGDGSSVKEIPQPQGPWVTSGH